MKKETLEEIFNIIDDEKCRYSTEESEFWHHYKIGVLDGLKWHQEQYSTEEKHIGHTINEFDKTYIKGFNDGAKWQQERSYSEEEVENILIEYVKTNPTKPYRVISWFYQFKKK